MSEPISPGERSNIEAMSPRPRRDIEPILSADGEQRQGGSETRNALLIGILAHGFLESLDFSAGPDRLKIELSRYVEQQPDRLFGARRAAIIEDLRQIFSVFFASSAFAELSSATILGREIPLLIPLADQVMEGVIDLLYERHGSLYVADYKTDRVPSGRWGEIRAHYRRQAAIYSYAVRLSLKRDIKAFKLFFLRAGEAIELKTDTPEGGLFLSEP